VSKAITVIVEVREGNIELESLLIDEQNGLDEYEWFQEMYQGGPELMLFDTLKPKDGRYEIVGELVSENIQTDQGDEYDEYFHVISTKKLMNLRLNATILGYRVTLFWAWYDMWFGAYYDRKSKSLYLGMFPTLMLRIRK